MPAPRAPSVLYVVTTLDVGGAEAVVVDLARRFQSRGWRVAVACLVAPGPLAAPLAAAGIPVHWLGMRLGVPDPRGAWRLRRLVRAEAPDVVHAHMVHANLLARFTRLLCPMRRLICTAHNVDEGGRLRELLYRATDRLTDLTTNVGEEATARYVAVGAAPAGRIVTVDNGIDVERFRPDEGRRRLTREALGLDGGFAWLAVGRLHAQKSYPTLLRALAALPPRSAPPLLLVAGEGPERAALEALAARLGVAPLVRFLGLRRDVPDLMRAADGFVLSSDFEGSALVLLEAAATALPIATTRVGVAADLVGPVTPGHVVPPGDDRALARAMAAVMDLDAAARRALGEALRARVVATHSAPVIADRWEALYRAS